MASVLQQISTWAHELAGSRAAEDAFANAKLAALDCLGVGLAARGNRISSLIERLPEFQGGNGERSPILGHSSTALPGDAAFANAALCHELDYDDSSADLGGHPTAVILPAALAVGYELNASGRDTLEAYVLGVEVACALGRSLHPAHYDSGWHPTATLGVFGSTVAAGTLYGFDESELAQALGLAVSLVAGVKANFGTLTKPLQVARAAKNGIQACEYVRAGADANPESFEGKQGFLDVIARQQTSGFDITLPTVGGQPWSLVDPAIIIKRYPCCGSTHAAIDVATLLREAVEGEEITSCRIRVHPARRSHVDNPDPDSGLAAKFSLQYAVATALQRGEISLRDFTEDDRLWDPVVRDLMSRTVVEDLPIPRESEKGRFRSEVEVEVGGRTIRESVPFAKGRARGEMLDPAEIRAKFLDCCGVAGLTAGDSEMLAEFVSKLDDLESVRQLPVWSLA